MAILFMDGFDHYVVPDSGDDLRGPLSGNYTTSSLTSNTRGSIETMPQLGGGSLRLGISAGMSIGEGRIVRPFNEPKTSGWIAAGFHVYYTSLENNQRTFAFGDGATLNYASFTLNGNGNFVVYPGTSGSSLGTSALTYSTNILYHIEFRLTFGNPGSLELRVDGQTVVSVPHTLTNPITDCKFHAANTSSLNGSRFYLTNFFLCDDTGDVNNDWMGERNVYTLRPNADETPQDWALSSGTDGFDLLNDRPSDPDTNYIESTSLGDVSQFSVDDLPSVDILVSAVSIHTQAQKTGTSDTEIDIGISTNSVTEARTQTLVQDQALWNSSTFEINPDTEEPWLPAEVNSLETYVERVL